MREAWTEIKGKKYRLTAATDLVKHINRKRRMLLFILTRYKMLLRVQPFGKEYVAYCPFMVTWSEDHALRISLSKGRWQCNGCNREGGAVEFLAYKESIPVELAAVMICSWFPHEWNCNVIRR